MNTETELDLIVGHVYSAKRPKLIHFIGEGDFFDDRQIIYYDGLTVQYDSPSVKPGKNYPKIPAEKFIKWAAADITDAMPKNEWRKAKD